MDMIPIGFKPKVTIVEALGELNGSTPALHNGTPLDATYNGILWCGGAKKIPEIELIAKRDSMQALADIDTLEASITPRMLRGAALGDQYSIDILTSIEAEIKALRRT